jgi:hypothetical protein
MRPLCVMLSIALLPEAVSRAEQPTTIVSEKERYPESQIERPMILPRRLIQSTLETGVTVASDGVVYASDTTVFGGTPGETLAVGLDVGLTRRLQAGIFLSFPLAPNGGFGAFLANVQLGLAPWLNLRVDLGAAQVFVRGDAGPGFVVGFGAPIQRRLTRRLAFVSGSTAARGFGSQPLIADRWGASLYGVGDTFSNDLFTLRVLDFAGARVTAGALSLPVGLLIQAHSKLSIGLRSGYRLTFVRGTAFPGTMWTHYLPFALDFAIHIIRRLDFGVSASLAGFISSSNAGAKPVNYPDLRQVDIWLAARF